MKWMLALVVLCAGCAGPGGEPAPTPEETPEPAPVVVVEPEEAQAARPGTRWSPHDGWQPETPSSNMRLAQYRLPLADGDTEDTHVIIYHFGVGGGGTVEANVERWRGQFATVTAENRFDSVEFPSGGKLTTLDITGTWSAQAMPGEGEVENRDGHRLIAGVVEAEGGPWFIKVLGPKGTIGKWEATIEAFLRHAAAYAPE
ncbi:MAG: hypothetical protein ACYTG4_10755 [Planctomycetota bacterium]|jgi:hypothetical protein